MIDAEFLKRIKWVLGDRLKHPWGREIGLKNSRIDSIFKGQMPTADALLKIREKERVSIDWLLTGEGPPRIDKNELKEEAQLLASFRHLSSKRRKAVLEVLAGIKE